MIDKDYIESLIRMLDESTLDNLEIERGGTRVRLSKSPDGAVSEPAQPAPAPGPSADVPTPSTDASGGVVAAGPASDLIEVTSPMVGTFYRAPAPDAEPYVEVGSVVSEGDILCIIEAMKLLNELECEVSGRITEICVENAEPVDFGQVLFRVDPT